MDPSMLKLGLKTAAGTLASPAGQALAGGAGYLLGQLTPEARAERRQLRKDTEAMRQGKLGLSDAEKRSMLAGSMRGIQAQTAGAEAGLRRMAAAQGGFGRSGAQQNALLGLQGMKAEKAAGAMGQLDKQSQDLALSRQQDVMNRLAQRRKEQIEAATGAAKGVAALPQTIIDERARVRAEAEGKAVPGVFDATQLAQALIKKMGETPTATR